MSKKKSQLLLLLIQYSFDPTRESWEYVLPNAMEWNMFPEIRASHRIVEENLETINSIGCSTPREGHRSYTAGKQWGPENRSWFMIVSLTCTDSLKSASVKVNPDGSFERLEISWQTRIK